MTGGPAVLGEGSVTGVGDEDVECVGGSVSGAGAGLLLQPAMRSTPTATPARTKIEPPPRRTAAFTTQTPPIGLQDTGPGGPPSATYPCPTRPAIPRMRDCGRPARRARLTTQRRTTDHSTPHE